MDNLYQNQLDSYLTNPGSFNGSPGFQFALNNGLDATSRKLSAGGFNGSGNALAELTKYGTGLATQDYGNTIDRLGGLSGQEQRYTLGQGQNANTAQNNWWNYDLGQGQNANVAARNHNDFNINSGRNAIDWFGANTNRGVASGNQWLNDQNNQMNWGNYYRAGAKT